jgi:hypothetical protein
MVTNPERRFVQTALDLGIFRARRSIFGLFDIYARPGSRWLLNWLKARQIVDDLWHAPACAANHYHKTRLVFQPCTCGSARSTSDRGEKS